MVELRDFAKQLQVKRIVRGPVLAAAAEMKIKAEGGAAARSGVPCTLRGGPLVGAEP